MCYFCDWQEILEDLDSYKEINSCAEASLLRSILIKQQHIAPPQRAWIDTLLESKSNRASKQS